MKYVLQYRDFIGSVHFNSDDNIFFGKIEGINDLVTFEGATVGEIRTSFEEAVHDYLELCKMTGKEIFKSYKGSFNVRIAPELHKKAALLSQMMGISLNQFIKNAIEHEIADNHRYL